MPSSTAAGEVQNIPPPAYSVNDDSELPLYSISSSSRRNQNPTLKSSTNEPANPSNNASVNPYTNGFVNPHNTSPIPYNNTSVNPYNNRSIIATPEPVHPARHSRSNAASDVELADVNAPPPNNQGEAIPIVFKRSSSNHQKLFQYT